MYENDLTNEEWTPIAAANPGNEASTNAYVELKGITISHSALTITAGDSYPLFVTFNPSNASDIRLYWTSDDESVASVSEYGTVCGLKNGTANIKVKSNDGGFTQICKVTVGDPIKDFKLSKKSIAIETGDVVELKPIFTPEEPSNKTVFWSTDNSNIATVDTNGMVHGIKEGTAIITAITEDRGFTSTCNVSVSTKVYSVIDVTLSNTSLTFTEIGATKDLVATVRPLYASNQAVTWKSSDTKVATVTANGKLAAKVTAKGAGNTTITVTTEDGNHTAKCNINVSVYANCISLSKNTLTIEKGKASTLTATVGPTNVTNSNVSCISSNPKVATVTQMIKSGNKTTFSVNALGSGSTQLMFMTHNGLTAYCMITVVIYPTKVEICDIPEEMRAENAYPLSACIYPTDATNKAVTWSSSNKNVADIGASGLVCTKAAGKTTITVKTVDGNITASYVATVISKDAPSINKPEFPLPNYPIKPASTTNTELPEPDDPLGCIHEYTYSFATITPEKWYYLVNNTTKNYLISNAHYIVNPPVPVEKKVDEKWYYITAPQNTYCMCIATQVNSYDAKAYCEALVYDTDLNLLGTTGDLIEVKSGSKYFIRTYGIGSYLLYVNMVTYAYFSKHFDVDNSIREKLVETTISPRTFNNYLRRMDLVYDAMYDLTGILPCSGERITITKDPNNYNYLQYVYPGSPYIYYCNINYVLNELETESESWWGAGSAHEIGHLFDEDANTTWLFASEAIASYKAWLAIERSGGVIYSERLDDDTKKAYYKPLQYNWDKNLTAHINGVLNEADDNPYPYRMFIDTEKYGGSFSYGDDIVFLLNPIINTVGFDKGWEILSNVFKSYKIANINDMFKFDNYHYSCLQQNILASFINRCSYYLSAHLGYSVDVRDYWMESTRQLYRKNIELVV